MSEVYRNVSIIASVLISSDSGDEQNLTREDIAAAVEKASSNFPGAMGEEDKNRLVRELLSKYQTTIPRERKLVDEHWKPWLNNRRGSIEWRYWERYRQHLINKGDMTAAVLRRMDESTDTVLDFIGDPGKSGAWDIRGLCVGLVQSGKTSHYIGLINKAVDAGFKVIIILTGFTDSLRTQTQIRAEEGFLGWSRQSDNSIYSVGVGELDQRPRTDSVTTQVDDFKKVFARQFGINPGGNPLLFVIKKNASILRNLHQWILDYSNTDQNGKKFVADVPLLVIDDESDVGSCDVKRNRASSERDEEDADDDHDPSTINKLIRQILLSFEKKSYVGYTATPFANVLIHRDAETTDCGPDLFPKDFIVSLPSPSDHVGPDRIFGTNGRGEEDDTPGLPVIRHVPREECEGDEAWITPKHKIDYTPLYQDRQEVPPSVREAILSFILVIAARKIRGDGEKHNSMLIHVTRFVRVQNAVKEQVDQEMVRIVSRLRSGTADDQLLADFERLWNQDFTPTTGAISKLKDGPLYQNPTHSWPGVKAELRFAAESIVVRAIHGESGEVLDYVNYKQGLNVIAIGGAKLSRGLTLEGLSVSYFLRTSRMYDTLMQMGRWFGYRFGYLDLCRLYTTPLLENQFRHIASASRELGELFDTMERQRSNPSVFGLRILDHPTMQVTSSLKMQHGTQMRVSFSGAQLETIFFHRDADSVAANWACGSQLMQDVETEVNSDSGKATQLILENHSHKKVWAQVSAEPVMRFLGQYLDHPNARDVVSERFRQYIEKELQNGRLDEWTIVLAGKRESEAFDLGPQEISLVDRGWFHAALRGCDKKDPDVQTRHLSLIADSISQNTFCIRRLLDPVDESLSLSEDVRREALTITQDDYVLKQSNGASVPDKMPEKPRGWAYRKARSPRHGMLILYGINPSSDVSEGGSESGMPLLGYAISFPDAGPNASAVTYLVNNVYENQQRESFEND